MSTHYDKSTVLAAVQAGWAELAAALAPFDAAQRTVAHPPHGWSVQDVMAHIAFWEDYAGVRLAEAARGESPRLFGNITQADVDRINQGALDAGRARTLDAVAADFARAHEALVAQVRAIPDDPAAPFWALWPSPELPWQLVEWNTFGHYPEHIEMLRAWIGA